MTTTSLNFPLPAHHPPQVSPDGTMIVAVCCEQDEGLRGMGAAREVSNRIQKLRKRLGLQVRMFFCVLRGVGGVG